MIHRGGERVVLEGEADQVPDQIPGDIIFVIDEQKHLVFERSGVDLKVTIQVDLVEALCGFSRVVLKHLDGRGISISYPQSNKGPLSHVLKIPGEGMWQKKSDSRGDLYLNIDIQYPSYTWLEENKALDTLRAVLPRHESIHDLEGLDDVDEVESEETPDMGGFGSSEQDDGEWEDEEDDGQPQCRQQ